MIQLTRYNSSVNHTNGLLFINGRFVCYTLEDEHRATKVHSETRIPDGTYNIELRDFGGFDGKYKKIFGETFHKGMLWLKDVPGFDYILIHIGNTDKDTAGCILVGNSNVAGSNFIGGSKIAYTKIYPLIRDMIVNNKSLLPVQITIKTIG